jgi:hypothetical protein
MASYQRGTFVERHHGARSRLGALLIDLQRSIEIIKADIEHEESRAHGLSPDDPRYPVQCRALRSRLGNLTATLRTLDDRAKALMAGPAEG